VAERNGAFEEELVLFIGLIYVWINGIDQTLDRVVREAHIVRQLDCFVWSEVITCTDFKEPLCESVTLWGAIQTHVLLEIEDLDMGPQP
jgi:hypothetical protein